MQPTFASLLLVTVSVGFMAWLVWRAAGDVYHGPNACRRCRKAWVEKPGSICVLCAENSHPCSECGEKVVSYPNGRCAICAQW